MCLLTTLYPITDTRFVRSASSGMHGSRLDDDRVTGVEEVGTVICYEFQRSLSDDTELIKVMRLKGDDLLALDSHACAFDGTVSVGHGIIMEISVILVEQRKTFVMADHGHPMNFGV